MNRFAGGGVSLGVAISLYRSEVDLKRARGAANVSDRSEVDLKRARECCERSKCAEARERHASAKRPAEVNVVS